MRKKKKKPNSRHFIRQKTPLFYQDRLGTSKHRTHALREKNRDAFFAAGGDAAASDYNAELHVPGAADLQLHSSVLQDWSTNRAAQHNSAASTARVGRGGGEMSCVGGVLSKELRRQQQEAAAAAAAGGSAPKAAAPAAAGGKKAVSAAASSVHAEQKTALHRDLLWRLFWSGDQKNKAAAATDKNATRPSSTARAGSAGGGVAAVHMMR